MKCKIGEAKDRRVCTVVRRRRQADAQQRAAFA